LGQETFWNGIPKRCASGIDLSFDDGEAMV
jgi:hypothetical protein